MTNAGVVGPTYRGGKKDKKTTDIIEMQRNIKNNNQEVINFLDDMESWTKEVGGKDKDKALRDPNKKVST